MPRVHAALRVVVAALVTLGPVRAHASEPGGRPLPYFSQTEFGCAGACAAMVRRAFGDLSARPSDDDDLVDPARGGVSTTDLVARLRHRGYRATVVRNQAAALCTDAAVDPVIALLGSGRDRLHYVVVLGCEGGDVVFHDPVLGPGRRWSRARFEQEWSRSGYWMLRVESITTSPADRSPAPATRPDDTASPRRRAVFLARSGDPEGARQVLDGLIRANGDDAELRRLRAGVSLRQGRTRAAAADARRALDIAATDTVARRYLGAALHLAGERRDALREWNRIGEPAIGHVVVRGARGTRYAVLADAIDLRDGALLTPGLVTRTRRRLGALPTVRRVAVRHGIEADGTAGVEARVLERDTIPSWRPFLFGNALRWTVEREVEAEVANVFGAGDLWTVGGRTAPRRRAWWARVGLPGVPSGAWVATLAIGGFEETYDAGTVRGRSNIRRIDVRVSSWISSATRVTVGLARRADGEDARHDGVTTTLRWEGADTGLRVELGFDAWHGNGDANSFLGFAADVGVEFPKRRRGLRGVFDVSVCGVGDGAPPWSWPGAGVGRVRRGLLRAHPLLDDGRIVGPAFAPGLVNARAEGQWWAVSWGPVRVGAAAFVDLAHVTDRPADADTWADAGVGLRLDLPVTDRVLFVDPAFGLLDDATALTIGLR